MNKYYIMVESLDQMIDSFNSLSNKVYLASAQFKQLLIENMESENHAEILIDYTKKIDLNNNYEIVRKELAKCLNFYESNYSEKYELFSETKQTKKIKLLEKLLSKNILPQNIKTEINLIECNNYGDNAILLKDYWNGKECIGKCGYSGDFMINDEELFVCPNCAVIQENQRFVEQEKRAYTNDEVNSRKRTEPKWRAFGPRTIIGLNSNDFKGQKIDAKKTAMFNRLSKIQQSIFNGLERNLWEANPKMNSLCNNLNLPDYVKEDSWKIYVEVAKQKLTMGRSIEKFVAASVYAGIRVHNLSTSLEELVNVSLLDSRSIHKSLGLIVRKVLPKLKMKYMPIKSNALVYKIGNLLEFSLKAQNEANEMIKYALRHGLQSIGKDPKGLAAAALYLVTKPTEEKKTQTEIADAAKITEVTLRTRAKQINNCLKKRKNN